MDITLSPAIVGQAEKVHNAVLAHALRGTGVDEEQWVALNLTIAGAPAGVPFRTHVADLTQWGAETTDAAVAGLAEQGLISVDGDDVTATAAGLALSDRAKSWFGPLIARAYDRIPAADRALAGRVVAELTAALKHELAAAI